jgi:hypothetical protein
MAKISDIFNLNKTQFELDFVNIDPEKDFPVYLNPFVFSARQDLFSFEATRTIRSFFQHNLELIKINQTSKARSNFKHLNEANETCLGMSKGTPRGKGIGEENSEDVFESILNSEAVKSGLVDDLEDTAIFIDGIGKDKVSDMTTNIIRYNLIKYTQEQCKLHNIPLQSNVTSGIYWDITNKKWAQEYTDMLIINGKKILLVPKGVVSYVQEFNHDKYHQHFALEFLQDDHLARNTRLVQTTLDKKGNVKRRFVTKKSLKEEELPEGKFPLIDFTQKHPQVFKKFKEETSKLVKSLENEDIDNTDQNKIIDFLISELKNIPTGGDDASKYHSLMIGILELVFYPNLINPIKEHEINEGRKRIDICFDNAASGSGFFHRLQHSFQIPCQYIFFECKNYTKDVANPELDQMVGRLAPSRGKFGVILCRDIDNEALFMQRCKDSYKDNHGLIIPLTDKDIIDILEKKKDGVDQAEIILSNKARDIMA